MSSSFKQNIIIKKVDAALTKGLVVKRGTDDNHVNKCTAATDKAFGIMQNTTTAAEDLAEIAVPGGGAKGLAGGTVAFGDLLAADSNGKLVATTTTADRVIAIAMQAAVASDLFDVMVVAGAY